MPDTPLNPDALEAGAKALFMRERKYHTPTKECPVPPNWEDLTDTSMEHYRGNARAVLAAALPDADELLLVTIKLPKNPEHDPRNKKTGACEVSQECTDLTGEHHTVAVRSQKQVEALRDQFGHITRVERVDMNCDDLTAALPEREDERIEAWHAVASHPAFQECYNRERPLLESMLQRLTELHTSALPEVTSVEQLKALPIGSVILDGGGDAGIIEPGAILFVETNPLSPEYVAKHYLPARVLYRPSEQP